VQNFIPIQSGISSPHAHHENSFLLLFGFFRLPIAPTDFDAKYAKRRGSTQECGFVWVYFDPCLCKKGLYKGFWRYFRTFSTEKHL